MVRNLSYVKDILNTALQELEDFIPPGMMVSLEETACGELLKEQLPIV
jgi:hypothetical protein